MKILPTSQSVCEAAVDAVVVGVYSSDASGDVVSGAAAEIDKATGGALTRLFEAKEFAAMATEERAQETFERVTRSAVGRALIVGVDRLDYSKGLEERFLGYERFLSEYPEERKEVVLLQIAPPSRGSVESYQRIRNTLEGLAGRINGAHAALDWVPIRTIYAGEGSHIKPWHHIRNFFRVVRKTRRAMKAA